MYNLFYRGDLIDFADTYEEIKQIQADYLMWNERDFFIEYDEDD